MLLTILAATRARSAAEVSWGKETIPENELIAVVISDIIQAPNRVNPMPCETKAERSPLKMSTANDISIMTVITPEINPAVIPGITVPMFSMLRKVETFLLLSLGVSFVFT
jgi:hypothetical protein